MAGFIPTSFFIAYAIMSIPAGILIHRYGEKTVLFCGRLMPFIGKPRRGNLCPGLAGGAGGPLIVSAIADSTNLRIGMLFILVFVIYITAIGFRAKPLINSKTVKLKELFHRHH